MNWMLQLAWKIALLYIGCTALKYVIRNGNETFRTLLETTGLAIKIGCLSARKKLVDKLHKDAEEEEPVTENSERPRIKVEGTVV